MDRPASHLAASASGRRRPPRRGGRGRRYGRPRPARPPSPLVPPPSRWQETWAFFRSFLRRPLRVGSLVPSSPSLARAMLAGCPLKQARTVVEFGPGTGAFTRPILEAIGPRTLFIALELDGAHVRRLHRICPRARVYRDSAEHLGRYLYRHHTRWVDCVVSGLPWATMKPAVQDRILDSLLRHLSPEGTFTTFGYWHALRFRTARRFRRSLEQRFGEVEVSRVVWLNLPPAVVFRCRKPRRQNP